MQKQNIRHDMSHSKHSIRVNTALTLNVPFSINIICSNAASIPTTRKFEVEILRGAIIFLIVFAIALIISLGYQDLPPGRQINDAVVGTETDYLILGIEATTLIIASSNGVIYGFIAWLIYTILDKAGIIPKKQKQTVTQPTSETSA